MRDLRPNTKASTSHWKQDTNNLIWPIPFSVVACCSTRDQRNRWQKMNRLRRHTSETCGLDTLSRSAPHASFFRERLEEIAMIKSHHKRRVEHAFLVQRMCYVSVAWWRALRGKSNGIHSFLKTSLGLSHVEKLCMDMENWKTYRWFIWFFETDCCHFWDRFFVHTRKINGCWCMVMAEENFVMHHRQKGQRYGEQCCHPLTYKMCMRNPPSMLSSVPACSCSFCIHSTLN